MKPGHGRGARLWNKNKLFALFSSLKDTTFAIFEQKLFCFSFHVLLVMLKIHVFVSIKVFEKRLRLKKANCFEFTSLVLMRLTLNFNLFGGGTASFRRKFMPLPVF